MPTPVPLQPQDGSLDRLVVRAPVSASHGARWASMLAHLFGRQVHRVCSHGMQALTARTAAAKVAKVGYVRSRGAKAALVSIELRRDGTVAVGGLTVPAGFRVTVGVTLPTGAVWIHQGRLDGSTNLFMPTHWVAGHEAHAGLIDVTGCSTSTPSDLVATITGVGGNTHLGLATVHLVEVPVAALYPESGDYGIQIAWPDPRNYLETGADADGPKGLGSTIRLEQTARTEQRWWWQIVGYEDAAPGVGGDTWFVTGAMAAPNWRGPIAAGYNPIWRARIRAHYGTAAGMAVTIRVRYYAASGGTVRVTTTPVGGAPTNNDVACGVSAAWATVTATVTLAATGTGQESDIEIQFEGTGGDTIYVSQVAIYQTEAP